MKISKPNIVLVFILLLASILRFYNLSTYPALNADEAAIGYNAYSLIQTGKDEHGNPWPVHFQSFNDYKPGGYFYMVLPFVYFFGLSEWSVRLPGALMGVLTVLVVYFLVEELGLSLKRKYNLLALVASLLLAISPWHIHFSRGGWEVNVATFFITLGVLLFLKAIRNHHYFALSILAFVLSLYTYHAARVVVPLLGLSMLLIYRKHLLMKEKRRLFFGSLLFGLLLLLPLLANFTGEVGSRAAGVGIFADRGYIDRIEEKRARHENPNFILYRVLYNKPKELALEFSQNYLEHFWGHFLFISGDEIERNKVPEFGQLFIWQFPVLVVGMYALIATKERLGLVLAWLAAAPIPAALTFQSPHALRAQNMIIPLTILSAYGLVVMLDFLGKKINKKITLAGCYFVLAAVLVWDFFRYLHEYYVHLAKTYPYSSQYGVKELFEYIDNSEYKDRKIVVTTRYDQPYILFLFYSKFDPKEFQGHHILTARDKYGFSTVPAFDKYVFKSIDFETDKEVYRDSLIVGSDKDIPDEANVIKNIYGTNGFLYFQVVAN